MGGDRDNTKMTIWNRGESTWTVSRMELPDHILSVGAVYLNDELYIINCYKSLFKLDENMEWKQLADMNEERGDINNSCLEWNGYIWIFGGEDRDSVEVLKSVERYDPKQNILSDGVVYLDDELYLTDSYKSLFKLDKNITAGIILMIVPMWKYLTESIGVLAPLSLSLRFFLPLRLLFSFLKFCLTRE